IYQNSPNSPSSSMASSPAMSDDTCSTTRHSKPPTPPALYHDPSRILCFALILGIVAFNPLGSFVQKGSSLVGSEYQSNHLSRTILGYMSPDELGGSVWIRYLNFTVVDILVWMINLLICYRFFVAAVERRRLNYDAKQ